VDVAEKEVAPILGLLCVALGPLKPAELLGASTALKDSLLLERELTGPMRRYLSGSRESGYALGHPRFRDYLAQNVFAEADLTGFRSQLLEFCRGWRRHHSAYALNHLAAHLADQDLRPELSELISKDWKIARAAQTGSPRGLVSDLELAIQEELSSPVFSSVSLIRCALAYSTIVSFVESIPDDLFGTLTRLDRHREAMDYVSLLRSQERKATAYGVIATAFARRDMKAEAADILALSLASAERVADASGRVASVLRSTGVLQGLADQRLEGRAGAIIESAAIDLEKADELERVAVFFEAINRQDRAGEMRERAKAARDAAGSGFNLDFSWLSGYTAPAEPAAVTAESLLSEGRVDEALDLLLRDRDKLENSPPAPDNYSLWLQLAKGFLGAGDEDRARDATERACESAIESPTDIFRSKSSRLIDVTNNARAMGFTDIARRSAQAVSHVDGPGSLGELKTIAAVSDMLIDMGFAADAEASVDHMVRTIESAVARRMEASSIAALAAATALASRADEAGRLLELNASNENWQLGPQSEWIQHLLARVLTEGDEYVAGLHSRFDNPDSWKFQARTSVGRALVMAGRTEDAIEVAEHALADPDPIFANEEMVESARTLAACGEHRRALEVIEKVKGSSQGFSLSGKPELHSELAVLLAECQSADAAAHCQKVLDGSVNYALGGSHLVRYCELLVQLEERPKAIDLTRALVAAAGTMDPEGWDFARTLEDVARAAYVVGDDASLRRLKELALRPRNQSAQLKGRAAVASALAQRKSISEARNLLAPALEMMLSFGPDEYKANDYVEPIANALAHLKDLDSLRALHNWVRSANKYYQPRRVEALIPALARLGDKTTIEAALTNLVWDRRWQHSCALAAGAAALLQLGDADAATIKAREAVDAFLEETDGAVTPNVLPHLIPVLVATGHKEGLLQISQMTADKWPYRREYGPGVRLLLPALAAVGLDDVQPRPYKVFVSETSLVDEAKVDLAEVYAKRGLLDRAIAAAEEVRSPAARARAHVRIADVMARAGNTSSARERLLAALSRFPAVRGDGVLVAEMALLAIRIEINPSVPWMLKQTFLRATDIDVVSIDVASFRNAARAAARITDDALLKRVKAIVSVARSPVTRAAAGAAVMLALAETGRHDESSSLRDLVYRDVQDVGDVTLRVNPLLDMALASARLGRADEASRLVAQALDCARHSGRQTFLEVLSAAASIVVRDSSAVDIGRAIVEVDAFWD
jgi:tetratricopeptide (TPR) repeat protein